MYIYIYITDMYIYIYIYISVKIVSHKITNTPLCVLGKPEKIPCSISVGGRAPHGLTLHYRALQIRHKFAYIVKYTIKWLRLRPTHALLENSASTKLSTWRAASRLAQSAHFTAYMRHETLNCDTNTIQLP